MKRIFNAISVFILLVCFWACSDDSLQREAMVSETGSIAISLNSKNLESLSSVTVTITASDILEPIVESISLTDLSQPITMYHIPVGTDRELSFEGFDAEGNLMCTGSATGIDIFANQITLVELVLILVGAEGEVGGIEIRASLEIAPMIIAIVAYPAPVVAGNLVSLKASVGNPESVSVTWSAEAGSFSDASTLETSWTSPSFEGNYLITLAATDAQGSASFDFYLEVIEEPLPEGALVINEVLADPPDDLAGDANNDGERNTNDDEFIEVVNVTDNDINMSGFQLFDSSGVRHEFEEGVLLSAHTAIVVFGGGIPALSGVLSYTASTGGLSLSNSGDSMLLYDREDNVIDELSYGAEGGNNESLTRSPDLTGDFVGHSSVSEALFSPGTMVDGSEF